MINFLRKNYLPLSILIGALQISYFILNLNPAGAISVTSVSLPIQTDEVTSAMVADESLLNADISSTAAIAPSKIATTTALEWLTNREQTITGGKTFAQFPLLPGGTPTGTAPVSLTYLNSVITANTITAYAGEVLNNSAPVYLWGDTNTTGTNPNNTVDAGGNWQIPRETSGGSSFGDAIAHKFYLSPGQRVTQISFQNTKVGTPTGNIIFSIRPDNNGTPSSTMYSSSTVAASTFPGAQAWFNSGVSSTPPVFATTTFWIVATSTQIESDANEIAFRTSSGCANTGRETLLWSSVSSSWGTGATALCLMVKIDVMNIAGTAFMANAINASSSNSYVGIVNNTTTMGATATIQISGTINTSSTFQPGNRYYLTNTTGTLGTASGTISETVGVSLTTSTLLLKTFELQ